MFFRSVSHQLYGNCSHHLEIRTAGVEYLRANPERFIESYVGSSCSHHLEIRTAGVEYLRANPERFIESYVGSSWLQYLSSMSMTQT